MVSLPHEHATRAFGAWLASRVGPGDLVRLEGPLGAGKTTLVRGFLESLGHLGPVRSPTFNLLHVYDTSPPVIHADLYRVSDAAGTGLEDYSESHVLLIEWPDRLGPSRPGDIEVRLSFAGEGRRAEVSGLSEDGPV